MVLGHIMSVAGVCLVGVALDEFRVEVVVALVLFLVVRLLVPAAGVGKNY